MNNVKMLKSAKEYCDEYSDEVITTSKRILEGLERYESALVKGHDIAGLFEDFPIGESSYKNVLEEDYEWIIYDVFSEIGRDFSLELEFSPEIKSARNQECSLVLTKLIEDDPGREYYDWEFDYTLLSIWAYGIIDEFISHSKLHILEDVRIMHGALQKAIGAYSNSSGDSPWDKMMKLFDVMAIAYIALDMLPIGNED